MKGIEKLVKNHEKYQRIHRKYGLKCLDRQKKYPSLDTVPLSRGREASTEYEPCWPGKGFFAAPYRIVQCTPVHFVLSIYELYLSCRRRYSGIETGGYVAGTLPSYKLFYIIYFIHG